MPKQRYIFLDIDGVLANCKHRLHYIQGEEKDYEAFFNAIPDDTPYGNEEDNPKLISDLQESYGGTVILVTGRPEWTRQMTNDWLKKHYKALPQMLMRKDGDHRKSPVVKAELVTEFAQHHTVDECMVLDDMQDNIDAMCDALKTLMPDLHIAAAKLTPVEEEDVEA